MCRGAQHRTPPLVVFRGGTKEVQKIFAALHKFFGPLLEFQAGGWGMCAVYMCKDMLKEL